MLRIAVCEDDEIEREILIGLVESFAKERFLNLEIHGFASGEDFIKEFERKRYDIVFLDIFMKQIDGLETGRIVREMDGKTEIIYCTLTSDFAIEAYEVHAMGYLLKPYEPAKIGVLLDYYMQKYPKEDMGFLQVKSKRLTHVVMWKDIIYLESDNKVVTIHTKKDGNIRVYEKLGEFEKQLSDSRFLRCHQSYLVNMQHIIRCVENDFFMEGGQMVPIRKSGRKEVLDKYEAYRIALAREA